MESQTKKNIYVNFSNRYMIGPLQLRVTILSFFFGGGGGLKTSELCEMERAGKNKQDCHV